jgi:hypothetical protein
MEKEKRHVMGNDVYDKNFLTYLKLKETKETEALVSPSITDINCVYTFSCSVKWKVCSGLKILFPAFP